MLAHYFVLPSILMAVAQPPGISVKVTNADGVVILERQGSSPLYFNVSNVYKCRAVADDKTLTVKCSKDNVEYVEVLSTCPTTVSLPVGFTVLTECKHK